MNASPPDALRQEGRPTPPTRPGRGRRILTAIVAFAVIVALWSFFDGEPVPGTEHYGWQSLLPPLTTLVLVFLTREVIISLFLGIVMGGLVIGQANIIDGFLIPSIGSESYAFILIIYLWALGGLIGLWTRTGGAQHFAQWAGERMVKGPRSAKVFAWLMGVVFHQGGTISTVLAGTTVRPLTDKQKVSHEEAAYIVDSTASPAATIVPLNAWPIYVGGLIAGTAPLFETEQQAVSFFFMSVPLNFYSIFAVLMTLLFALELLPWEGRKMRAARIRARSTGQLDASGSRPIASEELTQIQVPENYPTGLSDFLVPLGVLIGVAATGIVPALLSRDISSINVPIAEAFGLSVLSAIVLAIVKGMSVQGVIDGFIDGIKGVTIGAVILGLAVTLGNVSGAVGTAAYIVETTAGSISPVLLPALFLFITMIVAFSTGTSWGTYAVVFPIAMPLAWAVHPEPFFMALCFAATVGGATWGDQCSPISDTTILSALATGSDVMDHVTTQLPLASVAAAAAAVMYVVLAFFAV